MRRWPCWPTLDAEQPLRAAGDVRVAAFDWPKVTARVVSVYETVTQTGEKVREDDRQGPGVFAGRLRRGSD